MGKTKVNSKDLVNKTFGEDGLLSQKIPNYRVREQQVELADMIVQSIEEEKGLIAEAPTGVGKSLAALVPAFAHIMKTDEPVIVVTSSIILQEQYIQKDIPLLEELYDFDVNAVLIKGRNNYVCMKKQVALSEGGGGSVQTSDQVKELDEVMKWAAFTKTGDKSELDFNPTYPVWSQIACVDSNECTGKMCPLFQNCHYYRERSKVSSAKLIICNYHYLFSDMQSDADMLPPTAKVIIMDEGHEVSDIARDFQEQKYHMDVHSNLIQQLVQNAEKVNPFAHDSEALVMDLEWDLVNATMIDMFVKLTHEYKMKPDRYRDFLSLDEIARTRLQTCAKDHINQLEEVWKTIDRYITKWGFSTDDIPYFVEVYGDEVTEWMIFLTNMLENLSEKRIFLEFFFRFDDYFDHSNDTMIFWIEPRKDSVSIHMKPTTGSGLTKRLFRKGSKYIPIAMSATLSAGGGFTHVKADLGIEDHESPVNELIVSSPFNLSENLLWYLPKDAPEGNKGEFHLKFVLDEMLKVIELLKGKTLCLFTSRKGMREAERFLQANVSNGIEVISQEKWPKQKIIEHMRANDNVVVIGTKSFFTGIDIQGPNLSAVLIDKIPFPMVGDPVNDYLLDQPRGFNVFSLPTAIITLKQGLGRLNRTVNDKGIVAIYDGRLRTARYRNRIFNSFDFKVQATASWDDVVSYVDTIKKDWDQSEEAIEERMHEAEIDDYFKNLF